ncbi:MAG: T9SS type A sorting domain-containing protein [bacterium]|nr:T9SS type A sorting domain-containing protein [bacterium]
MARSLYAPIASLNLFERKTMLSLVVSNYRSGGLRPISLFLMLALLVPGFVLAAGLPSPDIEEIRQEIQDNGYSFEVDDHFSSTISDEHRLNLRSGYTITDEYQRELNQNLKIFPMDKDPLPSNLSWVDLEGVTSVKNQGSCGSCWAFAATAEMESFIKIYYGKELDLSEQQSVSCNPYGASCDGGWASATYYVMQQQGAVTESCFPYLGVDPPHAPCIEEGLKKYGYVNGYNHISNDVEQIKQALQTGPVCTGISATDAFEGYSNGCFDQYGQSINHLVLIVGYDDRSCDDQGAWLIKNSWGPGFGQGGYIWVQYGRGGVGSSVTQLEYVAPPVSIDLVGGIEGAELNAGETREITWNTSGDPFSNVDIWLGTEGFCHDIMVASNAPNTGSFDWVVPNESTNYASLVIFPSGPGGIEQGYDMTHHMMRIVGHKVRYVSPIGSNSAPYETPETAAHSLDDALTACTGVDTVLVAGGQYNGSLTISGPVTMMGGFSDDFNERDPSLYPSRIMSGNTGLRFLSGSGDRGGVDSFVFEDCAGSTGSEPVGGRHGGAIIVSNCSPVIRNCEFNDNTAHPSGGVGYGGAICVIGGEPVIQSCSFSGNTASRGGAIGAFTGSVVTLNDCQLENNDCTDGFETNIGATLMVEESSLIMNGGSISGSSIAYEGAGLYATASNVELNGVEISLNQASAIGGGASIHGGFLTIRDGLIKDNTSGSGSGGGVFTEETAVSIFNTHFTGNSSSSLGGGLTCMSAQGQVENCLFENNTAANGGGLVVIAAGPTVVRNNIVINNQGDGLLTVGEEMVSDFNNIFDNLPGNYGSSTPGANDISQDPLFVNSAENDFGLAQFSPCIDAGMEDASCLDPDGSRADMGLLGGPAADFVAPSRVTGASLLQLGEGQIRLSWDASSEDNIDHYVVYRDSASVFVPSGMRAVATVDFPTTTFDDTPPFDCYYLVAAVDVHGYSGGYSERTYTSDQLTPVDEGSTPKVLAISGVVPNPFNPRTTVKFDLPRTGQMNLSIFDLRGRLVKNLASGQMQAGSHELVWSGRDERGQSAAAGVYFARLNSADGHRTIKMVLAK